jgi:hypothetical protein
VHDDRQDAREPQEHHVLRERGLQALVHHRVAAVLDHDHLAVEALQPRQRLGEDGRLLARAGELLVKRSRHCSPRRRRARGRW